MKNKKRFFSSWDRCTEDFEPALMELKANEKSLCSQDNLLAFNNGKGVWRLKLAGKNGKLFDCAYKSVGAKTPWRYAFRPSLPTREAENYIRFKEIGVPMPEVLAYGDVRKCFILKRSYLIVSFVENTMDGTVFMPGEPKRADLDEAEVFTKKNFEILAKLHRNRIYHKAFHVRNSLFRYDDAGNMEVFLIDVARCRTGKKDMRWQKVHDLHIWLLDMRFDEARGRRCVEHYCKFADDPRSPDELMDELKNFRRRPSAEPQSPFVG